MEDFFQCSVENPFLLGIRVSFFVIQTLAAWARSPWCTPHFTLCPSHGNSAFPFEKCRHDQRVVWFAVFVVVYVLGKYSGSVKQLVIAGRVCGVDGHTEHINLFGKRHPFV